MPILLNNFIANFSEYNLFFIGLIIFSIIALTFFVFEKAFEKKSIVLKLLSILLLISSFSAISILMIGSMQKDYCAQTKICMAVK